MRLHDTRWWRWAVRLAVPVGVVLLWRMTALEEAEWALWRRYTARSATVNLAGSAILLAVGYLLSATGPPAARVARIAVLALSIVGTIGALELPAVVFGHDYGQTFGTRENDAWLQLANGINQRDDELIHVHRPNSRFQGTVSGNLAWLGLPSPVRYHVNLKYDRHGFRNDVDFTQADVVVIGDSFVEGAETAQSQTVVAELARRLDVSAVNLGQSGYGPQQELVVLKRYGVPLSPRVVVWFLFGGNDLSDVDVYESRHHHLEAFLSRPPLGLRLFTRNALTALARLTTPPRRTASAVARRHEVWFSRADGNTEVLYLDAYEGPWTAHQWEVTSSTLLRAHELTARMDSDLLVVFIPRKLRVYEGFIRAAPGSFAYSWPPNNLPEVVAEFCRTHGIRFLDSTVSLRAAVAAGESVYLPDDVHWNVAGHRVVASAVAESIQRTGTVWASHSGTSK